MTRGYRVIGVDAFVDFYPRSMKEANLVSLSQTPTFQLIEADLRTADLEALLTGIDYVFYLTAQAGVRTSGGNGFRSYVEHNVLATQRLLEAALIHYSARQPGDAAHRAADTTMAPTELGFAPAWRLNEGLRMQAKMIEIVDNHENNALK